MMVVTKPKAYVLIIISFNHNKIKGNEELIVVILKFTLLHNQNDGWTVT
jgi:hypothetical protein